MKRQDIEFSEYSIREFTNIKYEGSVRLKKGFSTAVTVKEVCENGFVVQVSIWNSEGSEETTVDLDDLFCPADFNLNVVCDLKDLLLMPRKKIAEFVIPQVCQLVFSNSGRFIEVQMMSADHKNKCQTNTPSGHVDPEVSAQFFDL